MTEIEKKCNGSKTLIAKLKQEVTTRNTVNVYGEWFYGEFFYGECFYGDCFHGECFNGYAVNDCVPVLLLATKFK